jgi:peptidoglycan/xylan/chitin deacetylase (PgdA/CDA1 family)
MQFRLDRALSVGVMHPMARWGGSSRRVRTPILMYHSISPATGTQHPYFETHTSPEVFSRQMQVLSDDGYQTISLADALSRDEQDADQKQVVITFDDGYRDFYTHAFPTLIKHAFTATLFVVSTYPREPRLSRSGADYMTWNEIREVRAGGISIGSHSATHRHLSTLNERDLHSELADSKERIENVLGERVVSFSYPFAFPEPDKPFVARLKSILRSCGYENGVSTVIGTMAPGQEHFFLPRLPVNSFDDSRLFRAKLEGGYDWLRTLQHFYKKNIKRAGTKEQFANAGSY